MTDRALRVAFCVRPDLFRAPGGDTVQIQATMKALAQAGCDVTLIDTPRADLDGLDLVHVWHLERVSDSYAYYARARDGRIPVALSTIYWPWDGRPRRTGPTRRFRGEDWRKDAQLAVRRLLGCRAARQAAAVALRVGWAQCRHELLHGADVLLPNSHAEADLLAAEGADPQRIVVTPNVVDADVLDTVAQASPRERTGVVCVGHFCPRKNQELLIRALDGADVPVTFIGAARPMHRRYFRRCRRLAGRQHAFAGSVPPEQVWARLARAKLHVCASRAETPGLANLEAAALGCWNILPTCPPVQEYFADAATFYATNDVAALREAVLECLTRDPPADTTDPATRVRETYDLSVLQRSCLDAYERALAGP